MKRFSLDTVLGQGRVLATGVIAIALGTTTALAVGGPPAGAASAATPGVTNNSITLGATEPLTGVASAYSDIAPAIQAVFTWANKHGGVHGRKIIYNVKDDQYNPSLTTTLTHQLVLQDNIFADVGSLGTPTQLAVQPYLNGLKIPQLFILSGCNCWSSSKYPWSTGWEPPYTVDGKILGSYVVKNFKGKKIGFFTQSDEFGQDFLKGARMEVKARSVVAKETYAATTAAFVAGVNTQVAALQKAGAQVVMMASIPSFTDLFLSAAATLGYHPQLVIDGVSGDPAAIGAPAAITSPPPAAQALLNGAITNAWFPVEYETTNSWVKVAKKLLRHYDPEFSKTGLTADTLTGFIVGYTMVQALEAAGRNLTRQGLMNAIAKKAKTFKQPGFVPYSYSRTVHYGYEGDHLYQLSTSAPPIVVPSGQYIGGMPIGPTYRTNPGKGKVKIYKGKAPAVPAKLARTA